MIQSEELPDRATTSSYGIDDNGTRTQVSTYGTTITVPTIFNAQTADSEPYSKVDDKAHIKNTVTGMNDLEHRIKTVLPCSICVGINGI